jgi:uncharacterized membrane protein YhaH (DUF805 family)
MSEPAQPVQSSMGTTDTRLSRGGYWIRWAACIPISFVLNLLAGSTAMTVLILTLLGSIGLAVYMIYQGVKRMHDVDKSGWFILVPIYNLVLLLTDGTAGPNRFGDDPKGGTGAHLTAAWKCPSCGADNNSFDKVKCHACGAAKPASTGSAVPPAP